MTSIRGSVHRASSLSSLTSTNNLPAATRQKQNHHQQQQQREKHQQREREQQQGPGMAESAGQLLITRQVRQQPRRGCPSVSCG